MNTPKIGLQKWVRVLWITGGFFLFLCAAGGIGFSQTDLGKAAASYDSNLKEYKKAGLPETSADFVKTLAVQDEQNAGPRLKEILSEPKLQKLLSKIYLASYIKSSKPHGLTPAEWRSISAAMTELEKISNRPFCIIPRDWSVPANTPFPELSAVRALVRALDLKAQEELSTGDPKSAIRNLKLAARLATWLDDEGAVIGIHNRITNSEIVELALAKIVAHYANNAAVLAGCKSILAILQEPINLKGVLPAQAFVNVNAVDEIVHTGIPEYWVTSTARANNDWLLKYGGCLPIIRTAWKSRMIEVQLVGVGLLPRDAEDYSAWTAMFKAMSKVSDTQGPSYMIANFIFVDYQFLIEVVRKDRAALNVLSQAVEAAKVKLKSGRYPAALPITGKESLDLAIPGVTLKLDTKNGFKVWSIGQNGVDDGGLRDTKAQKDDFCVNLVN